MTAPTRSYRTHPFPLIGASLASLWLAATGAAQSHRISGVVTSADKRPLAGSAVTFHARPDAPADLLRPWQHLLAEPQAVTTQVAPDGRFQLRTTSSEGALVIRLTTPKKLTDTHGALRLGTQPIDTISCRPLGEITFAKKCDVHVQAIARHGTGFSLGHFPGRTSLRLPAGDYHFLLIEGNGVREFRHTLESGRRSAAPARSANSRFVTVAEDRANLRVRLRAWPNVPLPTRDGRTGMPPGDTPLRFRTHQVIPGGAHITAHWLDKPTLEVAPPITDPAQIVVLDASRNPVMDATVVAGTYSFRGFEPHSWSRTTAKGRGTAVLAETSSLLVSAPGFAPRLIDAPLGKSPSVSLEKGASLRVEVHGLREAPVGAIALQVIPENPLLTVTRHTDALGRAYLRDLPGGPIELRLIDQRYRRDSFTIQLKPGQTHQFRTKAHEGSRLFGKILLPDGKPATRAIVTLHNQANAQNSKPWILLTGPGGTFELGGLEEDALLRLSASANVNGTNFISDNHRVQPSDAPWEIKLRSEDPTMPGKGGRQGTRK